MSTPEGAAPEPQGRTLEDWTAHLAAELGVGDVAVDVAGLLDVARDVAHAVARPAAPLSLFVVGLAAGRAGGDPGAVAAASARTSALADAWAAEG